MTTATATKYQKASELPAEVREALIELVAHQMVAESALDGTFLKLCPDLRTRYDFCRILAQEARHAYALGQVLKGLGEDPEAWRERLGVRQEKQLEPGRQAGRERDWVMAFVGIQFLTDEVGRVIVEAGVDGCYEPLNKVFAGILREEKFHTRFGVEMLARACQTPAGRERAQAALDKYYPLNLRTLGRPDSPRDRRYRALGLRALSVAEMQAAYTAGVRPPVERLGLRLPDVSPQ